MLDLAEQLQPWFTQKREFAVATVASVTGSAPRTPGAALAVDRHGTVIGSVSGGCVESTLFELCQQALSDGAYRIESFGYSDDDAFAVGLTCGGELTAVIQPYQPQSHPHDYHTAAQAATDAAAGDPVELLHAIAPAWTTRIVRLTTAAPHRFGLPSLDQLAAEAAVGGPHQVGLHHSSDVTALLDVRHEAPQMLIFGATDFAAALAHAGAFIGYRVTVCDARPVFTTTERFPHAHEVVVDWPDRLLARTHIRPDTVICVLTHDARFDVTLLKAALASPARYVGAIGSRRTHSQRVMQLSDAGVTAEQLRRLRSPIGLDIGAATPQQTAISIVAEIMSSIANRPPAALSMTSGPIHR